ncbi:leucine-rich repeat protein [Leucobacter sp. W1153]|uniref:leucine-rich repeat protein n=1 Tax=Leucobacter sp. W1153 TaxID=3439064 RepID=UPI003F350E36
MQGEQAPRTREEHGFSLVELVIAIVIIGILSAIAIPVISGMNERADLASDQAAVHNLNSSTAIARVDAQDDPFTTAGSTDASLMSYLVDTGHLKAPVTPRTPDARFAWVMSDERWQLLLTDKFTTIGLAEGLYTGSNYWASVLRGSYTGSGTNILIPASLDGTALTAIYQEVFMGKGLTSVSFDPKGKIAHIHARAFQNNQLTELVLPDTLTRIDTRAFYGNPISRVRIPDSVTTIENNAFSNLTEITVGGGLRTLPDGAINGTNAFRNAYRAAGGGAGTYTWNGSAWIKSAP